MDPAKAPENAPRPTPKKATEPSEKREPMKQAGQPNTVETSTSDADEQEAAAIQRPPADS